MENSMRSKKIMMASAVQIVVNIVLALVKWLTGMATNSISLTADAVNNITDSASSLLTIAGTWLAGKKPDDAHPFGYGRLEYMTSMVIAVFILFTAFEVISDGISGILHPKPVQYTLVSVAIIVVSLLAKGIMGLYLKRQGKLLDAGTLRAAGADSFSDALLSSSLLVAAGVNLIWHLNIDGWISLLIGIFIAKTGLEIIKEALDELLGVGHDKELAEELIKTIEACPDILSAQDLILHNYGPSRNMGTVNVELPESMEIGQAYPIIHRLQTEILKKFHIYLVFGFYSVDPDSKMSGKIVEILQPMMAGDAHLLGWHALFADEKTHEIYVDIVVDHKADKHAVCAKVTKILEKAFPGWKAIVSIDTKF